MQDDGKESQASPDFEQLQARIEALLASIIEDTGELADIVNQVRQLPSYRPGMVSDTPGIEKKLHELKSVLRSMDGFTRLSTTMPLTLFPASPTHVSAFTSIEPYVQLPDNHRIEFNGPYATLNDLFNQGLGFGTVVEFYSSTIAGMDACTTCTLIMIDAYMRTESIDMKNVRFVTAEPVRYGPFFKRLEPVMGNDARLDCIKVAAIDTVQDARALLENLAFTIHVPKHGLVIINCIDTIIALLGYDSMARRDRLKSALYHALRQLARDNDAIVIVTSLIRGKPRQHERENCDYMTSVEPQSADCIRLRVLGRGQAYINKRNESFVVSTEPVAYAQAPIPVPARDVHQVDGAEDEVMARVEAIHKLLITLQEEREGNPVAQRIVIDMALSRSIVETADEAVKVMHELKKMGILADAGDGTVSVMR